MKKSFSMIELVFVIVVIGILAAVAMPKLWATRDDAVVTKVKTDIANIRSVIANYRTKNLMKGISSYPTTLDSAPINTQGSQLFTTVLDYPIYAKNSDGHWMKTASNSYKVKVLSTLVQFDYNSTNGHFDCNGLNSGDANTTCAKLTH